jgi:hypothetical protein
VKIGDLVEYIRDDSYSTHTCGIIIAEEKKIWGEVDFTSYKVLWGNCKVFSCYRENIRVMK